MVETGHFNFGLTIVVKILSISGQTAIIATAIQGWLRGDKMIFKLESIEKAKVSDG